MAQYYAITAHQLGTRYTRQGHEVQEMIWYVLAGPTATKAEAEKVGRASIGDVYVGSGTDMFRKTQHENLKVVSKSQLKKYHIEEGNPYE